MIERLHVDWTRCEGRGLCFELVPELLEADDWGYPLSRTGERAPALTPQTAEHARAAVAECPRLALRIRTEAQTSMMSRRSPMSTTEPRS